MSRATRCACGGFGWWTIFWILIPVSLATHWVNSVLYLSALSLMALVSGRWSAWQAARVEVKQHEDAEATKQDDLPERVVHELIAQTNLQPDSFAGTS